ncbi:hypothetical protein HAX54_020343 [Datura stramonium]|uniref:Uncharacterized protein n=1 Tax=Datura stramonium TaxID=4076 RepID=A0ABS8S2D7_DATST|nr:hypothetical protein [Datura stramonium]
MTREREDQTTSSGWWWPRILDNRSLADGSFGNNQNERKKIAARVLHQWFGWFTVAVQWWCRGGETRLCARREMKRETVVVRGEILPTLMVREESSPAAGLLHRRRRRGE